MWGRKQMSEMSYQLSQLTALNNRLQSDEAMYKMICESSADAFVYFDYAQKSIVHLGNWSHFFDFELNYIVKHNPTCQHLLMLVFVYFFHK